MAAIWSWPVRIEERQSAGGAGVRPDDRAVDHLDRLADALGVVQYLEQQVPRAAERPVAELTVD